MSSFASIRGHTIFTPALVLEPVVVDLGANRGEFAREVQTRFRARCYLVEGNPRLAELLRESRQFPVFNCAVSSDNGTIEFHIANNDEASSVLELTPESVHGKGVRETVRVQAKTLATLLAEIGCARVDLLKMDIEGGEIAVFQRTPVNVLRGIGQITAEFHSHPEFGFRIQDEVEKIIVRMRESGFIFLDFSYGTRRDVLFINRDFHHISWGQEILWTFRTNPPRWLQAAWNALPLALRNWLRTPANSVTGINREH